MEGRVQFQPGRLGCALEPKEPGFAGTGAVDPGAETEMEWEVRVEGLSSVMALTLCPLLLVADTERGGGTWLGFKLLGRWDGEVSWSADVEDMDNGWAAAEEPELAHSVYLDGPDGADCRKPVEVRPKSDGDMMSSVQRARQGWMCRGGRSGWTQLCGLGSDEMRAWMRR